jgi:hypothetical protein
MFLLQSVHRAYLFMCEIRAVGMVNSAFIATTLVLTHVSILLLQVSSLHPKYVL